MGSSLVSFHTLCHHHLLSPTCSGPSLVLFISYLFSLPHSNHTGFLLLQTGQKHLAAVLEILHLLFSFSTTLFPAFLHCETLLQCHLIRGRFSDHHVWSSNPLPSLSIVLLYFIFLHSITMKALYVYIDLSSSPAPTPLECNYHECRIFVFVTTISLATK